MKHNLLLLSAAALLSVQLAAQCVSVACPAPVVTTADSGSCGSIVSYSAPVATSSCVVANSNDTFQFTGAVQQYVVPAGVTSLTIKTWGAQGGANWVNNVNYGGYSQGDFAVTPGATLYVYVGGQATSITGGYNGGGNGEGGGKGGGGASDVRLVAGDFSSRIIVAGGGGGAGFWNNLHVVGGVGGGLAGGNGYRNTTSDPGGQGGTQTSSGTGTCVNFNVPAMAGGFGFGGSPSGCGCEGYGGGGGWWGGAGSGNCRGGGGGSGYLLPAATADSITSGVRIGNGMVVISRAGISVPVVTQTAGLPSGSLFPVGTTTNNFLADDGFGNTQTCSFTVTVSDNQAPVITNLPQAITQANDSGQCGASVNWSNVQATDNCSAQLSASATSGSFFPVGTSTVTYIATDPAGNADTASFTITITDSEAPVITCAANITAATDSGSCTASNIAVGTPAVTENCTLDSVYSNAPAVFPVGTTSVTWTAIDAAGNTATCVQLVTVADTTSPVFAGIIVALQICEGSVLQLQTPTATDNCQVTVTQTSGPQNGDTLTAGNFAAVYTATDSSGNTATISFPITVLPLPVITGGIVVPPNFADCSPPLTLTGFTPTGGTWSGTAVSNGVFDPTVFGSGNFVIQYNYTDFQGCSATITDTIFVDICFSITENSQSTFTLYPNPTTTQFWIETQQTGTLTLLSATGQVVRTQAITQLRESVSVNGLAPGVYLVQFTTRTGETTTGKLLIQE